MADEPKTVAAGALRPAQTAAIKLYTSKQMGDACEMLIAAELTLAGIPALKVPDNWPHYDVIAQPTGRQPERISVKSRTFKRGAAFVTYSETDQFDWLAAMILSQEQNALRRTAYLIPREVADRFARRDKPTSKTALLRYFRIDEMERLFGRYRDNFTLSTDGVVVQSATAALVAADTTSRSADQPSTPS